MTQPYNLQKNQRVIYLTLVTVLLSLFTVTVSQAQDSAFTTTSCLSFVPVEIEADCGTVTAPENPAEADGATIDLPVVIFRSEAATEDTPPVIFLQGGPGGSTLSLIPALLDEWISPLQQDRDVIFFDQRGTGLAVPSLTCPEFDEVILQDFEANWSVEEAEDIYTEAFGACATRLGEEGIDVAAYTSANNAADSVAIMDALGYEQASFYGGSYGTRLAQTIVRDFPERVASVVLDSAVPVEIDLFDEQAFKSEFALNRVFAACEADAACAAAYPDLANRFHETVARLDANPVTVAVTNPLTSEAYEAVVNGQDYIGAIFLSLQLPDLIPFLPLLMDSAANGTYETLAGPLSINLLLVGEISIGMFLSVNCHEEVYASSVEQMTTTWAETPLFENFAAAGAYGNAETLFALCDMWGAAPFDPMEVEPVVSDIPMLGLAGEFDPATPPIWTLSLTENFSNSVVYEFPTQTHTFGLLNSCAVSITREFLNDPTATEAAACLDNEVPLSFIVP